MTAESESRSQEPDAVAWLYVLLVTIGAAGLRFYRIGFRSLHNDETLQLNGIQTPSMDALIKHCTSVDLHPPLSYIIQKWFYAIDSSVVSLRFPSAIVGTLVVPLMFWVFKPLLGVRRSVLVAAVAAVSYVLIWYSRELRDYIFMYAAVAASLGFFIRIMMGQTERLPWALLLGFAVSNIVGVYCHYNTFLTWPIYVLIFAVLELTRKPLTIRWRLILGFAAVFVVALVAVLPAFAWIKPWRAVTQDRAIRPPVVLFAQEILAFGFGRGWRGCIWGVLLLCGCVSAWRSGARVRTILLAWVIVPTIGYVYIRGMSLKFVTSMPRYQIYLLLGFVPLLALGIDLLANSVSQKHRKSVLLFLVIAGFAIMWKPLTAYYNLAATGRMYGSIQESFESLGEKAVLLDNYYDMQHLRHFMPEEIRVAHPPIFGSPADFQKLRASEFISNSLREDPSLALFDGGAARFYSSAGTQWDWLDSHFSRSESFINHAGIYLMKLGLNFAALNNMEQRVDRLYFNRTEDLPAWFRSRGTRLGVSYGPDWYSVTLMDGRGKWRLLRTLPDAGTIFVVNSTSGPLQAGITFWIHGCRQGQEIRIESSSMGRPLVAVLNNGPARGMDLRTRQNFVQYVSLGALAGNSGGMLNLPVAVDWPLTQTSVTNVTWKPGVNTVKIVSAKPEGIILAKCELQE